MTADIKQISFSVDDIGNKSKSTKKHVKWVFEVKNDGEEEEGQEHTVEIKWSKLSGKVQFLVDGNDEKMEVKKPPFLFKRWESNDNNNNKGLTSLVVLGTAHTPSKNKLPSGFVKYDLIVNGQQLLKCPNKDGSPLVEMDGPGPHSIFDIIYPQGSDFHKSGKDGAPFRVKTKSDLNKAAEKELKRRSDIASQVKLLKAKSNQS